MTTSPQPQKNSFNYKITQFFLQNARLTIIFLILLLLLGLASVFFLKTTGFPKIEIKTALVVTIYPGASSETVNRDVTIPLEGKIKGIEGVENYVSNSENSTSIIRVSILDSVSVDTVKNKIQSAISDVKLPLGAQKPQINSISIAGADFIFSITAPTLQQEYDTYATLKTKLGEIPETSEIIPISNIQKNLQSLWIKIYWTKQP